MRDFKKIILLREPEEIYEALDRGIRNYIHSLKFMTKYYQEKWGKEHLYDFKGFYKGWLKNKDNNTLIIFYRDLIKDSENVVNQIERFLGLSETKKVKLGKENYTQNVLRNFTRKILFKGSKKSFVNKLKRFCF